MNKIIKFIFFEFLYLIFVVVGKMFDLFLKIFDIIANSKNEAIKNVVIVILSIIVFPLYIFNPFKYE